MQKNEKSIAKSLFFSFFSSLILHLSSFFTNFATNKPIVCMKRTLLLSWLIVSFFGIALYAQDMPAINPTAIFDGADGEEEGQSYSGSAPLTARFMANAENTDGWTAYYEWRFTREEEDTPYLIRYEEDTEYTFTTAGAHHIVLYATFTRGSEKVEYTDEYWSENDPITVSISESRLEMPNAFSPNDDRINDIYQAMGTQHGSGPQSIVEFDGYIFNRWGQQLYHWTDCYTYEAGWDGTYTGKPVKDGVYFCLVKAKGADGRRFTFRKDVNLLRGYREDTGTNGGE